jgi:hypothetical protein
MDHLFVLSLLKVILSENHVYASSATFRVWDGINITFQIDPPFWVVEVCKLTIVIDVNTDFIEGSSSTKLTEQPFGIEVDPLTALTKEFKSLNSC